METIKAYTDLEQSKKLAKILPHESADICYNDGELTIGYRPLAIERDDYIPAWSLAALLSVLPDETTDDDGDVYRNLFFHLKGKYVIQYPRLTTLWPSLLSEEADNPVDACVAMIEKLHELKKL